MADTGHANNLESWGKLAAASANLDQARINPPETLKLSEMTSFHTVCGGLQYAIGNSRADWRVVALDRAQGIEQFDSIAAQAVFLYEGRGADAESAGQARSYVRKLQGRRAEAPKPKLDENGNPILDETEKGVSAAQTSAAAQIATMYELIDFLEAQALYAEVTKTGFTVPELRAFVDGVAAKHELSIEKAAKLSTDRINRNKRYYLDPDCMLARAKQFKKIVGGEYGLNSPEYKAVNAIRFRKP